MIVITNNSASPFSGWVPLTSPRTNNQHHRETYASAPAASPDGVSLAPVTIHRGIKSGSARHVWVHVEKIGPAETVLVDVAQQTGLDFEPQPAIPHDMMADPMGRFACSINGRLLEMQGGPQIDGPALRTHFRALVGIATWADVWIVWVPTENWFRFEMVLNCAHPERSMVSEPYSAGFDLRVGNALIGYMGQRFGAVLVNDSMAQGQARSFAGIGAWLDRCTESEKASLAGLLVGSPAGVDLDWKEVVAGMGVPDAQAGFSARTWLLRNFSPAVLSMHRWDNPQLSIGVALNSGVTGAQEEQCFGANGAEVFAGDVTVSATALFVRYMVAMTYSRRPCHWREADGSLLDFDAHPNLFMWSGQPHFNTNVSPDRLGLPMNPQPIDCRGWFGPDRQHWFYGSLWLCMQMTQSDALQWQGDQQVRLVWFGETVRPGWPTSGMDAARSCGWFGILVLALWHALRADHERIKLVTRARERMDLVYKPQIPSGTPLILQPMQDDRLLSSLQTHYRDIVLDTGQRIDFAEQLPAGAVDWVPIYLWSKAWMPYQQSLWAYGMWLLAQLLNDTVAMDFVLKGALAVFHEGWKKQADGSWIEWDILGVMPAGGSLPPEQYQQGRGASRSGFFRHAWMPMCLWVAGEKEQEAADLYQRLEEEVRGGNGVSAWLPPWKRSPTLHMSTD